MAANQIDAVAAEVPANQVAAVGTLSSEPAWREVSGGERLEFRVAVPRSPSGKDVIECFLLPGKLAARLESVALGRALSIQGELRSRYWSSGGRVVSRLQVQVNSMRILPK